MQYFEVPRPSGDGLCSDRDCPCGLPGESIPWGTSYLYIPKEVVDFRRDALTLVQVQAKVERIQQQFGGGIIMLDQAITTPTLICERGARKRKLDLEVAAADAAHWWKTGKVEKKSTTATRKTAEEALEAARRKLPDDAFNVSRGEIVQEAEQGVVEVQAHTEEEATQACKSSAPTGASVKQAACVTEPSKGFLGIGKKPGVWRAEWSKPFRAKVTYKLPAVVTVRLKR